VIALPRIQAALLGASTVNAEQTGEIMTERRGKHVA
jgi:hypothetical protein